MAYICIDTSGNLTSLTLAEKGAAKATLTHEGPYHVESVAPLLVEILATNGIRKKDLEFVSVVVGPGGFSGLRVGVTFASVFAVALSLPVVELSALELRVLGIQGSWDYVLAVEDGKRKEVFFGVYQTDKTRQILVLEGHAKPEDLASLLLEEVPDLFDCSKRVVVAGGGLARYREQLSFTSSFSLDEGVSMEQNAEVLAQLSFLEFSSRRAIDPKAVTVKYLRDADARSNYLVLRKQISGSEVET